MDLIKFKERVKHGTLDFHPGPTYGFEDEDAAPYFKACGWAEDVDDDQEPDVVISIGELDIDPLTVWGDGEKKGMFVMPERAADKLGVPVEKAQTYRATFVPLEQLIAEGQVDG